MFYRKIAKNIFRYKRTQLNKILLVFLVITTVFSAACQMKETSDTPENLVVVKAPSDGVITKVLVSEGAKIGKDAPIVEIETNSEILNAPPENDLSKSGAATILNAQKEVDTAQNEVERTSTEVQRMESLVVSKSAPQAQLDAARAVFQKAQETLQAAKEREKSRETQMLIEKSRGAATTTGTISPPKIVTARVSDGGILKVLNVRVGQSVKAGQPLATVLQN